MPLPADQKLTVLISPSQRARLDQAAEDRDRTLGYLIRELIDAHYPEDPDA